MPISLVRCDDRVGHQPDDAEAGQQQRAAAEQADGRAALYSASCSLPRKRRLQQLHLREDARVDGPRGRAPAPAPAPPAGPTVLTSTTIDGRSAGSAR